jgi:hypothetical protein
MPSDADTERKDARAKRYPKVVTYDHLIQAAAIVDKELGIAGTRTTLFPSGSRTEEPSKQ